MNFCPNCGTKLNSQAKFCSGCGMKIDVITSSYENRTSKQLHSDTVTSCPYCGSPLNSFSSSCPGCGREIINREYATACQRLCEKLEEIENNRPRETVLSTISGLIDKATDNYRLKPTDQKKVEAISGFLVPNTKADILEFLMLAESRMEMSVLSADFYECLAANSMQQAWQAKHDQVLSKAELVIGSDPDFIKIRDAYKVKAAIKYKESGLCQYCGGEFKGVFKKVCQNCGKPKDY